MDKKAKAGQEASRKTSNVYDDGNIPGGENSSKNRAE